MLILGIESSCDETAAAVVKDGVEILSNVVVSQIDIFKEYGGVIPEVAARSHLEAILPVVKKALSDAGVTKEEIDAIAVTYAPGLLGSLLIGTLTARMLAILWGKPLFAVHHLKSHIYANWLKKATASEISASTDALLVHGMSNTAHSATPVSLNSLNAEASLSSDLGESRSGRSPLVADAPEKDLSLFPALPPAATSVSSHISDSSDGAPQFPLIALVVSGGHTQIIYMPSHNQFEIIGTTRDDAVGECFDKVAKILGLPYPGGPSIAKCAAGQDVLSLSETVSLSESNLPTGGRDSDPAQPKASPQTIKYPVQGSLGKLDPRQPGYNPQEKNTAIHLQPGNPKAYRLPIPRVEGLDFSFSGLKTAVLRAVQAELGLPISTPSYELAAKLSEQQRADFAASFQETAAEVLMHKLEMALEAHSEAKTVVLAGGVSANKVLRKKVLRRFKMGLDGKLACCRQGCRSLDRIPPTEGRGPDPRQPGKLSPTSQFAAQCQSAPSGDFVSQDRREIQVFFPDVKLAGDNAAMVGAAAYFEIKTGVEPTDPYALDIMPRVEIR